MKLHPVCVCVPSAQLGTVYVSFARNTAFISTMPHFVRQDPGFRPVIDHEQNGANPQLTCDELQNKILMLVCGHAKE